MVRCAGVDVSYSAVTPFQPAVLLQSLRHRDINAPVSINVIPTACTFDFQRNFHFSVEFSSDPEPSNSPRFIICWSLDIYLELLLQCKFMGDSACFIDSQA